MSDIQYLCDRRACKRCSYPQCQHTKDISHAAHFKVGMDGNSYWEEAPMLYILRPKGRMSQKDLARLRAEISETFEQGFLVIPEYVEVVAPMEDRIQNAQKDLYQDALEAMRNFGVSTEIVVPYDESEHLVQDLLESQGLPRDFKFSEDADKAFERYIKTWSLNMREEKTDEQSYIL